MSNRYIRQSLEREMILASVGEKEVSTFINFAVKDALRARTVTTYEKNRGKE